MKVAFIGLGQMGGPMSRRLIDAGFDVTVYDSSPHILADFGERGAESGAEAARDADVVVTMLPTGKIVRDVLLGSGSALDHVAQDAVILDMSSSDPLGTREIAGELAARGHALVDAPVSGGMGAAAEGKLTIMVGADQPSAIDRVMPILERLGGRIVRVGSAGSGHAVKAINNAIAATIIAATSEGFVVGERFGVDPHVLLDVINSSTGRSGVSETIFKSQMLPRSFKVGFQLGLMTKDVATAASLAAALEVDAPVMLSTAAGWRAASDAIGPTEDFSTYLKHVEQQSGGRPISEKAAGL
jgi:3-hydroxyisobutyrate dehydrogenase